VNLPSVIKTPLRAVRSALVAGRDRFDGIRHPSRHRSARAKVTAYRGEQITFVCLGNVCRSPYAAWSLGTRLASPEIRSAGFIGPGRTPPERALEAARKRGVDHAAHRSRVLTAEDVNGSSLIVIFDRFNQKRLRSVPGVTLEQVVWLGDLDPVWTGKRAIIDPWGKDQEYFDRTFERIDRCLDELVEALS
jgi:protein-tyrosine phosphatase